MEETKLVLNTKNIRKVAFAVGVGFTVGKAVGAYVNSIIDGALLGTLKGLAKCGNKLAQETCKCNNIEYEESDKKKEDSEGFKMGFHA